MLNVRICVGTYCYITGGAELAQIRALLPQAIRDKIEFIGSACLGCHDKGITPNPPYAKVGDVLIGNCTIDMLMEEIYKQLGLDRN